MMRFVTCLIVFLWFYPGLVFGDCNASKTKSHTKARFKLVEGEVLDLKTNLIWSRCSLGTTWKEGVGCNGKQKTMSLKNAKKHAQKLGNGWRVPTVRELYSIVEMECSEPAINSKVFPDVKNLGEGSPYWSTSRVKEMPMLFYYVDFMSGRVDAHSEGFALAVRLVRSKK